MQSIIHDDIKTLRAKRSKLENSIPKVRGLKKKLVCLLKDTHNNRSVTQIDRLQKAIGVQLASLKTQLNYIDINSRIMELENSSRSDDVSDFDDSAFKFDNCFKPLTVPILDTDIYDGISPFQYDDTIYANWPNGHGKLLQTPYSTEDESYPYSATTLDDIVYQHPNAYYMSNGDVKNRTRIRQKLHEITRLVNDQDYMNGFLDESTSDQIDDQLTAIIHLFNL